MGRPMHESISGESTRWLASGILLCLIAAVWLFIGSSSAAKSDKNSEGEQLLTKADQRFYFRLRGSPPIRIDQTFSVWTRTHGSVQGTDTLIWADVDHWKETLKIQDYVETKVGGHESVWSVRNQPIPTLEAWKARELLRSRDYDARLEVAKVGGIHEIQVGQSIEKCVSVNTKQGGNPNLCFDPINGDLLSSTAKWSDDETKSEWSDFIDLGAHSIPRHTRKYLNGKLIGQSSITNAAVLASVDSENFAPPDGAEEAYSCEHPMPAVPIRARENESAIAEMYSGTQGTLTIYLKIDDRGNVATVGVMEALDPKRDEKAMRTIKSEWKFKPTTCGETSIPSEIEETFTFKSS